MSSIYPSGVTDLNIRRALIQLIEGQSPDTSAISDYQIRKCIQDIAAGKAPGSINTVADYEVKRVLKSISN